MKTDCYLKTVLTIIAICLTILVVRDLDILPAAYAGSTEEHLPSATNYAWVPVNEDGSINVRVVSSEETLKIDIDRIGGRWVRSGAAFLPVKVKD
jgi:hypothetical protein